MILSNGVEIPDMGFGTYRTQVDDAAASVKAAIAAGYRHIDAAAIYGNEEQVGEGIAESGVDRKQLFITSKLRNSERGYDSALRAFDKSLKDLKLDYLDLYLIHWPASPFYFDDWKLLNAYSWKALERLYREGRVRAIGLSNFMPRHMNALLESAEYMPHVNQIEFHPGWMQDDCRDYCRERNIAVEAWAPLMNGVILENETVKAIASAHGCSVPQVVLSWVLECGVIALCKSVTPSRIKENLEAPAIKLSAEEIATISALKGCGGRCYNPDLCNF